MSASAVYDAICRETEIRGVSIYEPINLINAQKAKVIPTTQSLYFDQALTFNDCYIREFDASILLFKAHLAFRRCTFVKANFYSTYVLSGLTIEQCHFKHDVVLLASGGHNLPARSIIIKHSVFDGYVDIHDAFFGGPVDVRGCNFKKGTNLFGNKGQWCHVNFDWGPPVIENNLGKLDLDGELVIWNTPHNTTPQSTT